jgi:DNA-binding GntR family transcriptional regulator
VTTARDADRLIEAVHARLVEMIHLGQLAPHERLHQVQLAERCGVRRSPVREALFCT